uniref:Uncharacterized protein n=1 Tax=Parastrongyloides trichosuri TaxID=131310 RepID=A0A0N4ZSL8_PARTI
MFVSCDVFLLISIILSIIFTNTNVVNSHGVVSDIFGGSHSSEYSYEESGSYEHSHRHNRRRRPGNKRRRHNQGKNRRGRAG